MRRSTRLFHTIKFGKFIDGFEWWPLGSTPDFLNMRELGQSRRK